MTIGNFLWEEHPSPEAIRLRLGFGDDGERLGGIEVPSDTLMAMFAHQYPRTENDLPLATALGYAVIIAAKAGRALVLTGDPAAWNPRWGRLLGARLEASSS